MVRLFCHVLHLLLAVREQYTLTLRSYSNSTYAMSWLMYAYVEHTLISVCIYCIETHIGKGRKGEYYEIMIMSIPKAFLIDSAFRAWFKRDGMEETFTYTSDLFQIYIVFLQMFNHSTITFGHELDWDWVRFRYTNESPVMSRLLQ